MRRTSLFLALAVSTVVTAQSSFAAVQYDFRQTTRSDVSALPPTELTGRTTIDGTRSRIDFVGGNVYPPGTYVVSGAGARNLVFIDPTQHSYTEVNAGALTTALANTKITVENLKSELTKLEDHPVYAGIPTDHYRLTLNYTITVPFGNIALTQAVHTTIDKWTTITFGDIPETFLGTTHVGNAQLDQVIDTEMTKIKGIALRESDTTITTSSRSAMPGSQLQLSPTRTQTREITVTAIRNAPVTEAQFKLPASYHRAEPGTRDPDQGPNLHVLSLEPKS